MCEELHKTISDESEWKIHLIDDNDIENRFLIFLQTLDILDTKKVPLVIMTDELDQGLTNFIFIGLFC
jgi:hypothetical protein